MTEVWRGEAGEAAWRADPANLAQMTPGEQMSVLLERAEYHTGDNINLIARWGELSGPESSNFEMAVTTASRDPLGNIRQLTALSHYPGSEHSDRAWHIARPAAIAAKGKILDFGQGHITEQLVALEVLAQGQPTDRLAVLLADAAESLGSLPNVYARVRRTLGRASAYAGDHDGAMTYRLSIPEKRYVGSPNRYEPLPLHAHYRDQIALAILDADVQTGLHIRPGEDLRLISRASNILPRAQLKLQGGLERPDAELWQEIDAGLDAHWNSYDISTRQEIIADLLRYDPARAIDRAFGMTRVYPHPNDRVMFAESSAYINSVDSVAQHLARIGDHAGAQGVVSRLISETRERLSQLPPAERNSVWQAYLPNLLRAHLDIAAAMQVRITAHRSPDEAFALLGAMEFRDNEIVTYSNFRHGLALVLAEQGQIAEATAMIDALPGDDEIDREFKCEAYLRIAEIIKQHNPGVVVSA